ncbi:FG-GAP-like repeat-containing protein [Streptomyces sp. NPDC000594]|uniref:FG-GAP-like repeat-containing protein n=1 Tax=Streptomyces sp. NPDC000594 TaxID=3154261 RepID=UPI00332A39CD
MTSRRTTAGLGTTAAIAVLTSLLAPAASVAAAPAPKKPVAKADDFNGDGYGDTAVGATMATVNGQQAAGFVSVLYGSAAGPRKGRKQLLHQDIPGIPGAAGSPNFYGSALATGDLDRDGYTDLIVGAPGETVGSLTTAGTLSVVWGGKGGLKGGTVLARGTAANMSLGNWLTAGDFDGDGDQDIAASENAQQLRILSGPFDRKGKARGSRAVSSGQGTFIHGVTSGDLNGDRKADIVTVGSGTPGALAQVWKGTAQGPASPAPVRNPSGNSLTPWSLDAGDINKDGYEDLVIGHPNGGLIIHLPGSAKGLATDRIRFINQETPGVPGSTPPRDNWEDWDDFGHTVSIGDIDGDGYGDIAVGAPGEKVGIFKRAGAVITLRGTGSGPTGKGARLLHQDTDGVPGTVEYNDGLGIAVRLLDTNGDRRAELISGGARENSTAGGFWVFPGSRTGSTGKGTAAYGPQHFGAERGKTGLGVVIAR